jgi:hypothetical protein
MKKLYRTFKAYYLLKYRNKFKATMIAFFATTFTIMFIGFVIAILKGSKSDKRPDYERNPNKYKVVYREGLIFTTKEYHQR